MKNEISLFDYIKACGYSVLSLSEVLEKNNKYTKQMLSFFEKGEYDKIEKGMLAALKFLFEPMKEKYPLSVSGGKLRYLLLEEFILKGPMSNIEERIDETDLLIVQFKDLFQTDSFQDLRKFGGPSQKQYREKFQKIVLEEVESAGGDIRFPTTYFGSNVMKSLRYVFFTSNKLHKGIRNETENKVRWQSIDDPFFFTICVDPFYKKKGIVCELWFCEGKEVYEKWKDRLKELGECEIEEKKPKGSGKTTVFCRWVIKNFPLEEVSLRFELGNFLDTGYTKTIEEISEFLTH